MNEEVVELRMSKRARVESSFGPDFVTNFLVGDSLLQDEEITSLFVLEDNPTTYEEAIRSIDSSFWKEAINNEIESIKDNHTGNCVNFPKGLNQFHVNGFSLRK